MITENEVVERVTSYLRDNGYEVSQSLGTYEKGVDIVAEKDGFTLYVEAKGATSSKEGSSRFGKGFDKNQVKTHVAMAILASMKILSSKPDAKAGIALPDNTDHRELIEETKPSLEKLGLIIFWVGEGSVLVN